MIFDFPQEIKLRDFLKKKFLGFKLCENFASRIFSTNNILGTQALQKYWS